MGATGGVSGADDEIRTRDIDLGKVALYQLSYIRTTGEPVGVMLFHHSPAGAVATDGPWPRGDGNAVLGILLHR